MPLSQIPTIHHKGVTLTMNFLKIVGSGDVQYEIKAECTNGTFFFPRRSVLVELSKECRIKGFKELERSETLPIGTRAARVVFDFEVPRRPYFKAAFLAAVSTRVRRLYL